MPRDAIARQRGAKLINITPTGNELIYFGNFVYQNGSLKYLLHPEGRILLNEGVFAYEYWLRDHLGNTRLVFSDDNGDGEVLAADGEIHQINDYYPFGLKHNIPSYPNDAAQKYLYNGKLKRSGSPAFLAGELQEGTDWLDYGARMYDAALGKWFVVDPLAEKYQSWSAYNYVLNNPIRLIDPDGNAPGDLFGGWNPLKDLWNEVTGFAEYVGDNIGDWTLDALSWTDVDDAFVVGTMLPGGAEPQHVNDEPASNFDQGAAIAGLALPFVSGSCVGKVIKKIDGAKHGEKAADVTHKVTLRESAEIGQEAHRQLQKGLIDQGAKKEVIITLKDGRKVRKDAKMPDGTFVIIKPNTPSGHKSAKGREKLMKDNGFKTKIMFYEPWDPRYRKDSPFYIGSKKKSK